ncbi:hypothetical protein [Streptomyces sp. DSM 40484]|uniref:hypothetical protein n=1 Tax=Streptomyces kroppenstedtii TaxID=3051181 RepID=UPI0028D4CBAE|nr:hypothetical protein [Streptomyces sp. DSM 40484]
MITIAFRAENRPTASRRIEEHATVADAVQPTHFDGRGVSRYFETPCAGFIEFSARDLLLCPADGTHVRTK